MTLKMIKRQIYQQLIFTKVCIIGLLMALSLEMAISFGHHTLIGKFIGRSVTPLHEWVRTTPSLGLGERDLGVMLFIGLGLLSTAWFLRCFEHYKRVVSPHLARKADVE